MADPEVPVEGPVAGGRYRAVSDPSSTSASAPSTVPATTPPVGPTAPGEDVVGAEPEVVRGAAAELDGLGDELDHWAEATAGLRLELGPQGRRDDGRGGEVAWAPAGSWDQGGRGGEVAWAPAGSWDQGGRGDEVGWAPAGPRRDAVAWEAVAVPGLAERRRRAHAELVALEPDDGPRRFAAQESERALHALADVWRRGLAQRAEGLHAVAARATGTAEQMDVAGNQ